MSSLRGGLSFGWVALSGLAFGHLVGVRYTSSLFIIGVLVGLWVSTSDGSACSTSLGLAELLLGRGAWLYINWIMLGVNRPSKGALEFRGAVVENSLFGMSFKFRALNYPFVPEVVRTAWNPFPTFIWLPLQVDDALVNYRLVLLGLGCGTSVSIRSAFWILLAMRCTT